MASKSQRKERNKRKKNAKEARKWVPQEHKDRPTPERLAKGGMKADMSKIVDLGSWELGNTDLAGVTVAKDNSAHVIDGLEHRGVISNEQASAAREYERLYRAATETPGTRDSCTLWEPKGYESDDGNVNAVRDRKELYLFLGVVRDRLLRSVCVHHQEPKPREVGLVREALNECVRFFEHGKRAPRKGDYEDAYHLVQWDRAKKRTPPDPGSYGVTDLGRKTYKEFSYRAEGFKKIPRFEE